MQSLILRYPRRRRKDGSSEVVLLELKAKRLTFERFELGAEMNDAPELLSHQLYNFRSKISVDERELDRMLLELIRDRFPNEVTFRDWLGEKCIAFQDEYEFRDPLKLIEGQENSKEVEDGKA